MYGRQERRYKVLVGRTEVKKPLGRLRRGRENNIKMNLQEWNGRMDWIVLVLQRDSWRYLVNAVMKFRVP
jgi:hypothetical protein